MTIADTLREARRRIEEPERWGKGPDRAAYNQECASDAIVNLFPYYAQTIANRAKGLLARVIGTLSISDWNDAPERTHAEVLAAFDRAIALAEGRGGENVMDAFDKWFDAEQGHLPNSLATGDPNVRHWLNKAFHARDATITKLVAALRLIQGHSTNVRDVDIAAEALAELEKP